MILSLNKPTTSIIYNSKLFIRIYALTWTQETLHLS